MTVPEQTEDPQSPAVLEAESYRPKVDAAPVTSMKAVLAAYAKCAQCVLLYPRHSTIRIEMEEKFSAQLAAHVDAHGESTLTVTEDGLVYEDQTVLADENRSRSLAFRLFLSGVRRIVFRHGITHPEAVGIVDVLTRTYESGGDQDDLRIAVWEQCFENVDFAILDDLLDEGEDAEFGAFAAAPAAAPTTAASARQELEPVWQELPGGDGTPVFFLEQELLEALQAEAETDAGRDLLTEVSRFLVEALDGPEAHNIHAEMASFLEQMVADGEIVRAATLLSALRHAAENDADADRRKLLEAALERVASTRVVPCIRPLLPTLADEQREALVVLMVALGESAIAPLCDLLDSDARDVGLQALESLGPKYPQALLPFVQHPHKEVVRGVVVLLGKCGDPEVASGLVPAVHHADVGIRREALRSLAQLGGGRVTDLFLEALDDPAYEVRALALATLAEKRDARAGRKLIERIDEAKFLSADVYEKRETFRTLGKIATPEVIVKLTTVLKTKGGFLRKGKFDEVRALAAAALGLVGTSAAKHALLAHEKDANEGVRRAVATALKQIESL